MPLSFDPDLVRQFVGPDLGPICLQRLSADYKVAKCKKLTSKCLEIFIHIQWLFAKKNPKYNEIRYSDKFTTLLVSSLDARKPDFVVCK